MGQYRPEHQVGGTNYTAINRKPTTQEMEDAFVAAKHAGLHRLDKRHEPFVLAWR